MDQGSQWLKVRHLLITCLLFGSAGVGWAFAVLCPCLPVSSHSDQQPPGVPFCWCDADGLENLAMTLKAQLRTTHPPSTHIPSVKSSPVAKPSVGGFGKYASFLGRT